MTSSLNTIIIIALIFLCQIISVIFLVTLPNFVVTAFAFPYSLWGWQNQNTQPLKAIPQNTPQNWVIENEIY